MKSHRLPQSGSVISYRHITEGNIITINPHCKCTKSPHIVDVGMVGIGDDSAVRLLSN